MRRRYEVWFVRLELADGSGACWLRYLLMNPGRGGWGINPEGKPVQVWATWFPVGEKPEGFIQGFEASELAISRKGHAPFHFQVGENKVEEDRCCGALQVNGHSISWDLRYCSTFQTTLSNKGWIGFSRTPHSDAIFSGQMTLDGRSVSGDPVAFGVQGHNCGYRHRDFWIWTHAFFPRKTTNATTFEALVYDMPFGLVFRKAVLWHEGREYTSRNFQEMRASRKAMRWQFRCAAERLQLQAFIEGSGLGLHQASYMKTDCTGSFDVLNNSLASASLLIEQNGRPAELLETKTGAVLEMAGNYSSL